LKYPPALLDEIRARLPVSAVVGKRVALKKAGREWRGLSPFKSEKSPSFFVNDIKGFYHCFASGEHGDIFTFVMKTEGLTFPEAIERLGQEAGVALPKEQPRNQQREDERTRLVDLVEASAKFFEQALQAPDAEHARIYITQKRGLKPATIERFRLGYAPDNRNALKTHLAKLGFSNDDMIASGMLIGGTDIPVSYDRFRNRVMFPITDIKGRVIAFGGRALDADAPAKYLNSPETPLFHKGHILFNAATARRVAHDKGRIIAVEGYMDVVALASAGFGESVAPLGTALTADQAKLLWRMAPEPILCFDGDSAGKKAAHRAIDVVLPELVPGKSLRFAFMPDSYDPDDLIKQRGAAAMEEVLSSTRSLVDVLFEREYAKGEWTTPERRAALEQTLYGLVGQIKDEQVRGYYADDMRSRINKAFGRRDDGAMVVVQHAPAPPQRNDADDPSEGRRFHERAGQGRNGQRTGQGPGQGLGQGPGQGPGQRSGQPWQARFAGRGTGWKPPGLLDQPMAPSDSLKQSLVDRADVPTREALILRAAVNHPWLIEDYWEALASLDFVSPAAKRLRDALLSVPADDAPLDTSVVRDQLSRSGLDTVLARLDSNGSHKGDRFAEPDTEREQVETGWRHAVAIHGQETLRRALVAAEAAWLEDQSEDAFARIAELKRMQARPIDFDDPSA
jgi:DNA primase